MGSYKGYSLFISASSTESEGYHLRIPYVTILPLVLIAVFITVAFFGSVGYGGKYAWSSIKKQTELHKRNSLNRELAVLQSDSEKYNDTLRKIIKADTDRRISYGLAPLDSGVVGAGIGGTVSKVNEAIDNFEHADIISALKLQEKFELYSRQTTLVDSTLLRVKHHIEKQEARLRETPSIWPTEGRKTSKFGKRFHPILKTSTFHDGLDIANREWTPLIAPADGVVEKAHNSTGGYGKVIVIAHEASGFHTKYAHCAGMEVKAGDVVKRGELIGYMGNTGRSTGTHLHYEVLKNGRIVDPERYLIDKVPYKK